MSISFQGSQRQTLSAAALLAACVALLISFLGLSQFDLPIVRYVRSVTIHLPWDQLTIPWMAFTSDVGNWIGDGWHLTALSLVLLALGWVRTQPNMIVAAIQSLIAHGVTALVVNGLKHVIGRPRPKFTHVGDWHMSVSWVSGWDSFPSGHSAASFAVATVFAKRFPAVGPVCLGVAAFVALSRVLRGSHFPTDVVGGAVLGSLSGALASAPLKEWRTSLEDGIRHAAIGVSTVFAMLWTLSHPIDDGLVGMLFLVLATMTFFGALWLRRGRWSMARESREGWQPKMSILLIAYGLAALTTSPLVLSSAGLVCLAVWLAPTGLSSETDQHSLGSPVLRESVLLGGLLLGVSLLIGAREVLPFR